MELRPYFQRKYTLIAEFGSPIKQVELKHNLRVDINAMTPEAPFMAIDKGTRGLLLRGLNPTSLHKNRQNTLLYLRKTGILPHLTLSLYWEQMGLESIFNRSNAICEFSGYRMDGHIPLIIA